MSVPKTMFQLSGRGFPPTRIANASLIIIDAQKEYLSGDLALSGMDEALANIAKLMAAARAAKRPVVHIRHLGTVGGLFDPRAGVASSSKVSNPRATKRWWKSACPTPSTTPGCMSCCRATVT